MKINKLKLGERLYALNKRAKGEGVVEYDEFGNFMVKGSDGYWHTATEEEIKNTTNDLSSEELGQLYCVKNKILKKFGTPTNTFHRFPGYKVGLLYKIGEYSFHRLGYAHDLIDDLNKEAGEPKYTYYQADSAESIFSISSEIEKNIRPLSKKDFLWIKSLL